MIDLHHTFPVLFTYDHASGLFQAQLPNSARFTFDESTCSGKLRNALSLFKQGVIASQSGRYVQAPAKSNLAYSYDESQVRRVGRVRGRRPELNLDLGDLQL